MNVIREITARPSALSMLDRLALKENDADNAARLLSVFGEDLLFVVGKNWAVWDDHRYSFQAGDLAAIEIAHKLRDLILEEARFAESESWDPTEHDRKAWLMSLSKRDQDEFAPWPLAACVEMIRENKGRRLRAHAVKCGNVAKVEAALKTCQHQRRAVVEDMDRDPFQFVTPNGQVDLLAAMQWQRPEGCSEAEELAARASWLKPIARDPLPSRCAGVAYDPAANCPQWREFVALIVPDADVRACLQRSLGAMLFGENRAQVCLILRGPGGNGKSTLLNGLQTVLGTRDGYAATCKIDMFLETGNANASGATPEEVDLPGARAYIATEPGARDVLSAKKIKGLTGGDRRMSRGLFKDSFFWTPQGVPILSCNRTPKIKDEDEGTRRRLVFIPLDVNLRALPPEKQVPPGKMEKRLKAEGPGILNWLIDGFRDFMSIGIAPPDSMNALKERLMEAADPVGVFLEEMTVKSSDGRLNVTEFYKVHERWCEDEGRSLYQMKTVGDVLVEKGFERGKSMGRSVWRGLAWSDAAADLVEDVTGTRPQGASRPEVPDF